MPTFVTPLLLSGGLLVAVPILLHLVMREKPRHLEFPALRFIQQRREANRRRLRLRHLLLLLLRCAAILLFAIALARPIFQSAGILSGQAPVAAALVFDTRPRMQYRHRNETRLETSQTMGRGALQQIPADSDLVVMDAGPPRVRFDVDRGAATQRIDQLAVTYQQRDLIEMLDGALSVLRQSEKQRKEIYVFTDMSATDWTAEGAQRWQQRLDENPDVSIFLVDVGIDKPQNFALGDLQLSREVMPENGVLTVATDVLCTGEGGDRTVQLFLEGADGNREKKSEQIVTCRADEAVRVEFKTTIDRPATQQGFVRLARSDNLDVDNDRYFTVNVQRPWQILIAAADPPERSARLLAGALAPATLRRRGEAPYELDVIATSQLEQKQLDAYDAIWLLDPTPLKTAVWNRLTTYVAEGGGLAIALGGRAGLAANAFNATASLELLPAELKRQWKQYDLYLAPDRLEHPVLEQFKEREGAIPWDLNPIFKIWELGPLMEGVRIVAHYSDRRPALLARNVGSGRTLTLTTSLAGIGRSPWNQLLAPREEAWPGFVLVNSMTEYLVGSADQRLNYQVGDVAELRTDKTSKTYSAYLLNTPAGTRRIPASESGDRILVTGNDRPGQYRLEAGGKQGVRYGFSVNLPADSTRLGRLDIDQLRETLAAERLPIVQTTEQLRQSRKAAAARTNWEGYPWLIALVVIVIVAEGLLSSLFYRKKTN